MPVGGCRWAVGRGRMPVAVYGFRLPVIGDKTSTRSRASLRPDPARSASVGISVYQWFPLSGLHRRSHERCCIRPSPSVPGFRTSTPIPWTPSVRGGPASRGAISERHRAGGADQTDFFLRRRRARALTVGVAPASSGPSGDGAGAEKQRPRSRYPRTGAVLRSTVCGRGPVFTQNTGSQSCERGSCARGDFRPGRRSLRSGKRVANPPRASHAPIVISNAFLVRPSGPGPISR